MKKVLSVILSLVMVLSLSTTAFAVETQDNDGAFFCGDSEIEKAGVSANIVTSIFQSHYQPRIFASVLSESEITTEEIDKELSHLYMDITKAEEEFSNAPTTENQASLLALTTRKDSLEATLISRGFIFLTNDEASLLMTGTSASLSATGDKPADTSNTRYVASSINTVTLSDGRSVPYYYVTAYNKTTNSSMVKMPSIALNANKKSQVLSALIETYIGKAIGQALSYIPVISWLPYEMITYTTDSTAPCTYTIESVYTSTPKFIWSYSSNFNQYFLDGVVHTTNIEDLHIMRYSYNGHSTIDSHTNNYTYTSPLYYSPSTVVKNQWEQDKTTAYIEKVQDVKYYYQADKNNSATRTLVTTKQAPYATGYWDMN